MKNKREFKNKLISEGFVFEGIFWLLVFFVGLTLSLSGLIIAIKILLSIAMEPVGIVLKFFLFSFVGVSLIMFLLVYLIIRWFYEKLQKFFLKIFPLHYQIYIKILLYVSAYLVALIWIRNFYFFLGIKSFIVDFLVLILIFFVDWLSGKIFNLFKNSNKNKNE